VTGQTKNPLKVAAGRAGARVRWGDEPRHIRLDELDPATARLVRALIANSRSSAGTADDGTGGGSSGHG
jgi:hypothetical protein